VAKHLLFQSDAWNDYVYWQSQDNKTLQRVNTLIRECQRDPFRGLGKPEPLKERLSGCWSRRIDDSHRLVYRVEHAQIEIVSCRYHYGAR
jgi:toxin YoeB